MFEPTTDKSCFDEDEKIIVSDRFHWNWSHAPNRYGSNNSRLCPEGSICEQRCLDNSDNCVDEEMVASCVPADPENMPECHDVIQNHNNPNEPRINLIFVGLDYHRLYPEDHRRSLQTFLFDTRQLLTAPETGFIENMVISEKYNFWYVDRFLEIPLSEGQELGVVDNYNPDEHYSRWRVGVLSSKELAKTCGFTPNGENVLAVNIGINHGNGDSVISVPGKREVQLFRPDLFNQCKQATPASVEFMDNNNDSCLNSFDFPDFDPNIDQLPNSYSEDFDYNGDGEIEPPSIGRLRSADNSFFRSLIRTSKDISLCYGQNNQDIFENTTEYICGNANVLSSGQLANKLRGVANYQYGILKHETTHNFEIGHLSKVTIL